MLPGFIQRKTQWERFSWRSLPVFLWTTTTTTTTKSVKLNRRHRRVSLGFFLPSFDRFWWRLGWVGGRGLKVVVPYCPHWPSGNPSMACSRRQTKKKSNPPPSSRKKNHNNKAKKKIQFFSIKRKKGNTFHPRPLSLQVSVRNRSNPVLKSPVFFPSRSLKEPGFIFAWKKPPTRSLGVEKNSVKGQTAISTVRSRLSDGNSVKREAKNKNKRTSPRRGLSAPIGWKLG